MTTPDEVHAWTDDELRVKIAEALGWHYTRVDGFNQRYLANENQSAWITLDINDNPVRFNYVPDWARNLNAAAELEHPGFDLYVKIFSSVEGGLPKVITQLWDETGKRRHFEACGDTEANARAKVWYLWWLATGGKNE